MPEHAGWLLILWSSTMWLLGCVTGVHLRGTLDRRDAGRAELARREAEEAGRG